MGWFTLVAAPILAIGMSSGQFNDMSEPPTKEVIPEKTVESDAAALKAAFEKQLTDVDAKMSEIIDLRADFEQRKKTSLLKKPLISRGSVSCKNDAVLWRTTEPRKSDMLVTKEKVSVYYPEDKLAEMYPINSQFRDAAGGPLPRLSQLKTTFDLTEINIADVAGSVNSSDATIMIAVKLTPKSDELKKHIASVRVLINKSVPCADRIVIVDPEGDETELRFTAVKINTGLKDADLDLTLPADTKISKPSGPVK